MRWFVLGMSWMWIGIAQADTKISCESVVEGRKVKYLSVLYRPSIGGGSGALDPVPVLTVATPIGEEIDEVRTSTDPVLTRSRDGEKSDILKITQTLESIGVAGAGKRVRHVIYYQKKSKFKGEIRSYLLPGNVATMDCEEIKEASLLKEL